MKPDGVAVGIVLAAFAATLAIGAFGDGNTDATKAGLRGWSSKEIPRAAGALRVMAIVAHPDDADFRMGCLAVKLARQGARVRFVSVCNGNMGHQTMMPPELAARRKREAEEAGKRYGIERYDVLDNGDCSLMPDYERRVEIVKIIREFQPDFIVTHRTCDYHADHRAVGQLVQDAGYLLGVPHWIPEAPVQRKRPVILFATDTFSQPRPLRPDVMVDAEPYLEQWCEGVNCHVSQVYEWLPWDSGYQAELAKVKESKEARNAYLIRHWAGRKKNDAKRFAAVWGERYPDVPVPKYVEVFEVSEYGRTPSADDLARFAGLLK